MGRGTVEGLIAGLGDPERAQYLILAQMREARLAFARNAIYPHLSDLIRTFDVLESVFRNLAGLRDGFSGTPVGIDFDMGRLTYDRSQLSGGHLDHVSEFIQWALPRIRETIEEGRTIFEFVDGQLTLEEVGILPSYVEEGYLILPDTERGGYEVIRYELSIFSAAEERYRALRTSHVKHIPVGALVPSPQSVKLDLVCENRMLPNPATYCLRTDIEFPYESTILPIAKRKLMQRLSEPRGSA
ncbi:MAG: hypothetical protein R2832_01945 [Rhodothermales bacterium]